MELTSEPPPISVHVSMTTPFIAEYVSASTLTTDEPLPPVVALIELLAAEIFPAASFALTEKVYEVEGVRFVTV
jgi:hypothetical protein